MLTPKQIKELEAQAFANGTTLSDSNVLSVDQMCDVLEIKNKTEREEYVSEVDRICNSIGKKVSDELFEQAKAIIEKQRDQYELAVARGEIEPFDRSKYYEDDPDKVIPKSNYDEQKDILY